MHIMPPREIISEWTRLNPFERFADGRPRVPDDLIKRTKSVTTEVEAATTMKQLNRESRESTRMKN